MELSNIKIKFKDYNNNKLFSLILLFSLVYFIYFFIKTYFQAVWFDEADYLNYAKYLAQGYPSWSLGAVRPGLYPLIEAIFFKLNLGEIGLRIFMGLFYLTDVALVYLIGKELFNKNTALIASFLTSVFWSHLFFSYRLLVDVPVLTFWLLTIFFFIRGYINKKGSIYTILIIPSMILGFFMKYTNALEAIFLIIFLFITDRLRFLKDKDFLKSIGVGILLTIPFFIWQYISYGSPIAFLKATFIGRTTLGRSFFSSLIDHAKFLFSLEGILLMLISIIGIIYLLQVFLGFDLIFKNKDKELNKKFFLFLWIIITLLFAAKIGYGYYIEERYYFNFFIGLFLASALIISLVHDYISKYNKHIALIVIFILLFYIGYSNVQTANDVIVSKAGSFKQVKEAGLWLNQHLENDEGFLSPSTSAEMQYHSERKNFGSDINLALNDPKIKYVIISGFNGPNQGFLDSLEKNKDRLFPVAVYYIDGTNQPIVIILEVKR